MDSKDQIKEHISIVDVASLYVSLKPAGKNFKALCPFHSEKTPSFFVYPDKNSFSCFGCNRFGDIFAMVQEMENLGFRRSHAFSGRKIQYSPWKKPASKPLKKTIISKSMSWPSNFFKENLFASEEGQSGPGYLKQARPAKEHASNSSPWGTRPTPGTAWPGTCAKKGAARTRRWSWACWSKTTNERRYDRFRGRIIFPIFSETGTILAFGGRTIYRRCGQVPEFPRFARSTKKATTFSAST